VIAFFSCPNMRTGLQSRSPVVSWIDLVAAVVLKTLKKTTRFLGALAEDERIPARDKIVFAGLLAYLANPFDIIPDFIPLAGYVDDLFVAALVLDYVFNVVPEAVVREHFPWDPARLASLRRRVKFVSALVPGPLRRRIWKAAEKAK